MKRLSHTYLLLCFALSAFGQSKDKTNVQDIITGLKKIKYEATEVKKDKEKK